MNRYLLIDRTFRELDIPLKPAQHRELERNLQKNKPIEPIYVWNGYVLSGYERYDLYGKYNRMFRGQEMYFPRKSEAIVWACREQLKRKDLCKQAVCWLFHRLYDALAEIENRKAAKDQFQYRQLSPSYRSEYTIDSPKESTALLRQIGDEYNWNIATIRNYVRFGRHLDQLETMFPGFRIRVLKGEVEIPLMYMDALMQMPQQELEKMISDPDCRKLMPPESVISQIRMTRDPRYKKRIHVETAIKETPAYDPDADVNGLTYTVMAWVKAIKRADENMDFHNATWKGRENLQRALSALAIDIGSLFDKLEEAEHERIHQPD